MPQLIKHLRDFKKNIWLKTENTKNARTLRFYTKLKIHKEGIPGRPVISSVNCHNSKISGYADYHLQSIVWEIPS